MFANVNVLIIIRMKNFLKSRHEKMNMTDKGQTITVTIISRIYLSYILAIISKTSVIRRIFNLIKNSN